MLIIQTANANQAWRETLVRLVSSETPTDNELYFRDEPVVIELTTPSLEEPDPLFPMPKNEMETINKFIHSGADEENVMHDWTKLYYHRMFDEPNNQIEYLLSKLSQPEPAGEAVVSLWEKNVDQFQFVSPCTLVVWGRKRSGALELHIHAHSSDAYKKLLMNLQEFISLHHYLAKKLDLAIGKYYHFLDSCHVHTEDITACNLLVQKLLM